MHFDWILIPSLLALTATLVLVLRRTRAGKLLRERIADRPRRRLFLASVSFFLTFATVRGMVFCIVHHIPPFHYVMVEGRHIHPPLQAQCHKMCSSASGQSLPLDLQTK